MINSICPSHVQQYANQLSKLDVLDSKGNVGYLWYNTKKKKFKVIHNGTNHFITIDDRVNGIVKHYRRLSMHEINKWTLHYLPILKSHPTEGQQVSKGLINILDRRLQHPQDSSICHFVKTLFEHLYNWIEGWGWESSTTILEEAIDQLPVPDETEEDNITQQTTAQSQEEIEDQSVETDTPSTARLEKDPNFTNESDSDEEIESKPTLKPTTAVPLPSPAKQEPVTVQKVLDSFLLSTNCLLKFPTASELAHWTDDDWKALAQQFKQRPESSVNHFWEIWKTLQEVIQHQQIEDPSFFLLEQVLDECEKTGRFENLFDILGYNLGGRITKHATYSKMQDGIVKWIVQAPSLPVSQERLNKLNVFLFNDQLTKPNQTAFLTDDQRFRFFLAYRSIFSQIPMESVRTHFSQQTLNLYGTTIDLKTLADDPSLFASFVDTLDTEQKEEAMVLLLYLLSARNDVKAEHFMIIHKWILSYANEISYTFFRDCFFEVLKGQQKWDWFVQEIQTFPLDDRKLLLAAYLSYLFTPVTLDLGYNIKLEWKNIRWGLLHASPENCKLFLKTWEKHDSTLLKDYLNILIRQTQAQPNSDRKVYNVKACIKIAGLTI